MEVEPRQLQGHIFVSVTGLQINREILVAIHELVRDLAVVDHLCCRITLNSVALFGRVDARELGRIVDIR